MLSLDILRLAFVLLPGQFADVCHVDDTNRDDMNTDVLLFCKVTWVTSIEQRDVTNEVAAFLQARSEACMVIAGWWWHVTPSF